MEDFEAFLVRREAAAKEFCRGRPESLVALSSRQEPVSFFGPDGGVVEGAETVIEANTRASKTFGSNGQTSFDILQAEADGDLGFWCGVQKAVVEVGGKLTPMTLRVTEVFRREGEKWKLVHRQADELKA